MSENTYKVFLNDKGIEIASYSNLTYEQAQSIAKNLLESYQDSVISIVEEGK